jgi:hypothetical protein
VTWPAVIVAIFTAVTSCQDPTGTFLGGAVFFASLSYILFEEQPPQSSMVGSSHEPRPMRAASAAA